MRPAVLLFFLLPVITAQARLDETIQEIETRYGKPLKGVNAESPATVAGVYEKNGFRITVGFYQNRAYYEKFQKVDPKKANSFLEISDTERSALLKANCKGCNWVGNVLEKRLLLEGRTVYETTYNRSDGLATSTYDTDSKTLVVRSLQVELQKQADEKKRQQENLKGF
jgi:hypothetical protein